MFRLTLLSLVTAFAFGCGGSSTPEETTPDPMPVVDIAAEPVAVQELADPDDVHIVGDHITIDRHINFESDSDVILADSNELLDHIALLLMHHEEVQHLRIIGHTDAAGGHDHNQDLSERRSAAVVQALQTRGVTIPLDAAGVGELEPVCQEDTDECHAQNRRVEFLIITD